MSSASYTKLRDGSWGIRITGALRPVVNGDTLQVITKAGVAKTETVAKVLWSGNGVSICAIQQRARPVASSYSRGYSGERKCRCSHPIDEGDGECMTCGDRMW